MPYAADALREYVTQVFIAAGVSTAESRIVANSLIESNLRGHDSHGVMRTVEYVRYLQTKELVADAEFRVVSERAGLLVADGNYGFGQVQCRRLVERVAEKARACGVASGTLMRCGHVGRLGEWVELAAAQNLAAFLCVNDNGVEMIVAPPGGIEARISTNPLAIGVPTGDGPLVLDITTCAVANGKIKVARLAGREVPPGWIQDAAGEPTTDPHALAANPRGTLLPLGGNLAYKGFGLGLLLDTLAGGLSGGFCPPAPTGEKLANNVVLMIWDPTAFSGLDHFTGETDKLLDWVRSSPLKPGVERIQLPGDHSRETRAERLRSGIALPGDNARALFEVGHKLGIAPLQESPN